MSAATPDDDLSLRVSLKEHLTTHTDRLFEQAKNDMQRQEKAVAVALDAVETLAIIHATAHREQHDAHGQIHQLQQRAIDKAEEAINLRLYAMNEFRSAISDLSRDMLPRREMDALLKGVDTKVDKVEEDLKLHSIELASIRGRAAAFAVMLAILIPLISIAMNIVFAAFGK